MSVNLFPIFIEYCQKKAFKSHFPYMVNLYLRSIYTINVCIRSKYNKNLRIVLSEQLTKKKNWVLLSFFFEGCKWDISDISVDFPKNFIYILFYILSNTWRNRCLYLSFHFIFIWTVCLYIFIFSHKINVWIILFFRLIYICKKEMGLVMRFLILYSIKNSSL